MAFIFCGVKSFRSLPTHSSNAIAGVYICLYGTHPAETKVGNEWALELVNENISLS